MKRPQTAATMRALWADPAYRAAQRARIRAGMEDPTTRARNDWLPLADRAELLARYAAGESAYELANEYLISPTQVRRLFKEHASHQESNHEQSNGRESRA